MWVEQMCAATGVTIKETHSVVVGQGQNRMGMRGMVGVVLLFPYSVRRRGRMKMLRGRPLLLPMHSWEHCWWEIKLFFSPHRPGHSNKS